jgi:rhodanese-related sulfurtransferase
MPNKPSPSRGRVAAQRTFWVWILLGSFALSGLAGACAPAADLAPATTAPAEISLADAVARRAAGAFILDVRQPDEWRDFHVPGSTLIPLDQLQARVNEVPRDRDVVVVCRSGNRSATGRDVLKKAGFTRATSLAGGLTQWKAAGYPTVAGP